MTDSTAPTPTADASRRRPPPKLRFVSAGLFCACLVLLWMWADRHRSTVHASATTSHAPEPPRQLTSRQEAPDGRSGSFSVLSTNVGGVPDMLASDGPSRRMPLLAERFNAYDLVLVQGDHTYHEALERGAKHRYQSVTQASARRLLNDGLNRFSRFPFVPVDRVAWSTCHGLLDAEHDCLVNEGASVAETTLRGGAALHVYNHLADAGTGPLDREARARQFTQLASLIGHESHGEAVIVAGATHLAPDDPEDARILARFLSATGLRDACEALLCDSPQATRVFYREGEAVMLEPSLWELAPEFGRDGSALASSPPVHVRFRWQARRGNPATHTHID